MLFRPIGGHAFSEGGKELYLQHFYLMNSKIYTSYKRLCKKLAFLLELDSLPVTNELYLSCTGGSVGYFLEVRMEVISLPKMVLSFKNSSL